MHVLEIRNLFSLLYNWYMYVYRLYIFNTCSWLEDHDKNQPKKQYFINQVYYINEMILTDGNDNLDTGCLFSCCRQRSPDFVISGREGRSIHIKRHAIYIKGSLE